MRPSDRRSHPLFTVDRALLIGAISAGIWAGTADTRAGNQAERVATVEARQDQLMREKAAAELDTVRRLTRVETRLDEIDRRGENIEKGVSALASATARLANAVKDPR